MHGRGDGRRCASCSARGAARGRGRTSRRLRRRREGKPPCSGSWMGSWPRSLEPASRSAIDGGGEEEIEGAMRSPSSAARHRGASEAQRPAHSNGEARDRFVVNRDAAGGAATRTVVHARGQVQPRAPRVSKVMPIIHRGTGGATNCRSGHRATTTETAQGERCDRLAGCGAPRLHWSGALCVSRGSRGVCRSAVQQRDDEMVRPQTGVS